MTSSLGKLTKPQRDLLFQLSEGAQYVVSYYPPAIRLVDLGLAEWRTGRTEVALYITPAGRTALSESKE